MNYDINYDADDIIYIDGSEDPYGINDVMMKMAEIMLERDDTFEQDTDEPIVVDFTALSDSEMSALISEAVACIEFENEFMEYEWDKTEKNHFYS